MGTDAEAPMTSIAEIRALCEANILAYKVSKETFSETSHKANLPLINEIGRKGWHKYDGSGTTACSVCGRVDNTLQCAFHRPSLKPNNA
jgi:hypothetical protein